jgi:16S rRNA (guanine1207-N2)-methyltransferase
MARAFAQLAPGATLAVAGANALGPATYEKSLRALAPVGTLSKHHARVFWCARPERLPPEFTAWCKAAEPRPNADGLITVPGIFSAARVDPGSGLLAGHLPHDLSGRVADLGAGYGYLAKAALARCPAIARIDCYEAEALALDCARRNLAHDSRARFFWHDVAGGLPERGYDALLMNPPFHAGPEADPALGQAFIASAAASLRAGGRLLLVANRRLPYEAALRENFASVERLAESGGYKAIVARAGA